MDIIGVNAFALNRFLSTGSIANPKTGMTSEPTDLKACIMNAQGDVDSNLSGKVGETVFAFGGSQRHRPWGGAKSYTICARDLPFVQTGEPDTWNTPYALAIFAKIHGATESNAAVVYDTFSSFAWSREALKLPLHATMVIWKCKNCVYFSETHRQVIRMAFDEKYWESIERKVLRMVLDGAVKPAFESNIRGPMANGALQRLA